MPHIVLTKGDLRCCTKKHTLTHQQAYQSSGVARGTTATAMVIQLVAQSGPPNSSKKNDLKKLTGMDDFRRRLNGLSPRCIMTASCGLPCIPMRESMHELVGRACSVTYVHDHVDERSSIDL